MIWFQFHAYLMQHPLVQPDDESSHEGRVPAGPNPDDAGADVDTPDMESPAKASVDVGEVHEFDREDSIGE